MIISVSIIKHNFFLNRFFCCFFADVDCASEWAQQKTTVREMMEEVSGHFDVRFIYDSSLSLDSPYEGRPLRFRSLEKSLESLFSGTGIEWTIEDNGHIVLNMPKKPVRIAAAAELKEMSDTLDASKVISDRHTQKVRSARTGLEKLSDCRSARTH